ncbi:hypothetical protein [Streptomyces canus]|nr:hypothetical protein [Streptomyces canus]
MRDAAPTFSPHRSGAGAGTGAAGAAGLAVGGVCMVAAEVVDQVDDFC